MSLDARLQPYADKMSKSFKSMEDDFRAIRAGRANPAILDRIRVDYYGQPVPISQVGNITVPEARILQIQPWEPKMIKEITKAINMSDIGINPNNDGRVIRLIFPELTEERRKDLARDVKKKADDGKVAIRNIRRDCMDYLKKLKKSSEVSEDEIADLEDAIQKETDNWIKKIDKAAEEKTKEIMTV